MRVAHDSQTDSRTHLRAADSEVCATRPGRDKTLLNRDGRPRESRARQHRVLRVFAEPRIVLSIGPGIPPLPEPIGQPIDVDDALQFKPEVRRSRERYPSY